MATHGTEWAYHHWRGSAADFHAEQLGAGRALWWCDVDSPALILGSTQNESDISRRVAEESGIQIAQRRSGGGAVYVHPSDSVWIDITIPRDDVLWNDDVSQSMLWLGDVFVRAFTQWVNATTFRQSFDAGTDGRVVCFSSAAPGEVYVGEAKLVGISQRRSRDGARMQCIVYRRWAPEVWSPILTSVDVRRRLSDLAVATLEVPAADIVAAVRAELSRL